MLSRVLPAHGPGGLGAVAWDLAGALGRLGARVDVLTTAGGGGESAPGVFVRALAAPAARYSRAWWRGSCSAYLAMGPERFDAVLGVSAPANALAALPRRPRPVFVFQAHGTSVGEVASKLRSGRPRAWAGAPRNLWWGLARDRAYQDYDAVTAVGEAVRRQLAAWPTARLVGATPVTLIRNGVEAAAFRFDAGARRSLRSRLGLADEAPLALYAGRLQADKGPQRAVQALRLALAARPDLRLVLLGEGPERAGLERQIVGLGLQDRVRLIGTAPRADLAGWFSAADALVLPTARAEGLPLVVLEALASGLRVLTTPQGAADGELDCERLAHGDIEALAAAMARPQTNWDRDSRLPAAFHLDHSARSYLDLFDRLATRCARRRAA